MSSIPPSEPAALPANHFLSLPRPDTFLGPTTGAPDTTTLAAHDFDVDNRTGFMPPHPPLSRLPPTWDIWEHTLTSAQTLCLKPGDTPPNLMSSEEIKKSQKWKRSVNDMPMLETKGLRVSEVWLRRAHHVLAWMLHFYVHSQGHDGDDGDDDKIVIPKSLAIPLLRVCAQLQLPPVLTYSDNVLYNWDFNPSSTSSTSPTPTSPLQCQTLFTHTPTESSFYLVSARIELIGVRALSLMRATLDEIFVGDDIAVRRITSFLVQLAAVVGEMKSQMVALNKTCDPGVFFNEVRPWLRGCEEGGKRWVFDGLDEARGGAGGEEEEEEEIWEPVELSGPSAGQSSLIHALDIFLGVDKWSHATAGTSDNANTSFLTRMQQYMPRHHRHFLQHLATIPQPLREFVLEHTTTTGLGLVEAYNDAVKALKEFRDAHLIVVALFIVGPAARARAGAGERKPLKGTGGTDVVQYLKSVRDQTKTATLIT